MDLCVGCGVSVDVFAEFENTQGLSQRYNEFIDYCKGDYSFLACVHDDVIVNDQLFFDKVIDSKFDLIGVVGGIEYVPPVNWRERPFLWNHACNGRASGFVLHKHPQRDDIFIPSSFGPAPSPVVWLDGQCLIFNKKALESGLTFSECFDWHFYDGDVCFSAIQKGLKVGTAPILVTHASCGQSMMKSRDSYLKAQKLFITKWFSEVK